AGSLPPDSVPDQPSRRHKTLDGSRIRDISSFEAAPPSICSGRCLPGSEARSAKQGRAGVPGSPLLGAAGSRTLSRLAEQIPIPPCQVVPMKVAVTDYTFDTLDTETAVLAP